MSVDAVLDARLGSIVAPAGCGKTHLITEVLSVKNDKPVLVLTHTTAGVTALRNRLSRLSVPPSNFVITTIDGWALRIANTFPNSCPVSASPDSPSLFYPELRSSVYRFLSSENIHEALRASYSKLFVDEYQDCDVNQHNLIVAASTVLPTVVFGDPMQCIFDFSGPMPHWDEEVLQRFPLVTTLSTPWRWNNAQAPELGQWILSAREILSRGGSLDFQSCPGHLTHHRLTGVRPTDLTKQQQVQCSILNSHPEDTLLVIGDSINVRGRHTYARSSFGTGVVEPVQLKDVVRTAQKLDQASGLDLIDVVLEFASTVMTNVERPQTRRRLETIINGRNRTAPTEVEQALCDLANESSRPKLLNALNKLKHKTETRLYRRAAYTALHDSVSLALSSPEKSIAEAASIIREQIRQKGDRRIPKRAIGSTLLLKGLEADHSLILDANGMNPRHLYVALSRGAKSVSIFS